MIKTKEQETLVEEIKGTQEYIEKYFPIVKASTLSITDEFLKHEPESRNQTKFKNALILAIKSGLSDFRAQRMDPSLDENGNICFKLGMKPAVGDVDWNKIAKGFMPEKQSRLGTARERVAFLGLLIKYLIEKKGYTVSNAWKAVCDQSKDLGCYLDSKNTESQRVDEFFENTGSRQIGEWYDLGNTCKIVIDEEERRKTQLSSIFITGFEAIDLLLFGGHCCCSGSTYPLASVEKFDYAIYQYNCSVGWFVLAI